MMNDTVIKMESSCRYLGHMITDGLDDNEDIKRQLRSFYRKANMLLRTFNYCSADVKKQLFSSYCGSLYTCHLWCNYTVRQYRQMHVAYNNVFRRLMGYHNFCSASGMFVENRIDNFDARIRRLVYGFYQRLMCSGNSLVNCVMNSSAWLSSDLYRNWISVFMSQKWYYNHVFFSLLFYLLSFTFFSLSIVYILCKCYSIYGIPVIVYYVVYVTWKPAIKILYIYKPHKITNFKWFSSPLPVVFA